MFQCYSLYPSHPLCLGDRSLFFPFSHLILYCSSLLGSFQMPVLYSLEASLTLPAFHDLCRVLVSWSRTKLKLIPWVILNAFRVTEYYFNNPLAVPLGFHQHLFTSLTCVIPLSERSWDRWLKKYMQPKSWELCFIRWEFLGLQGWKTASPKKRWERQPWENCSEEARGAFKVIQKFCNKEQVVWTWKVFLGVRENQISQVKAFSAFLCMGRCKNLGSQKSFISRAPQLSGATVSRIFTPEFLSAHRGEWLQSDRCQIKGILFLLDCSWGSEILIWRAGIDDDCVMLVYW